MRFAIVRGPSSRHQSPWPRSRATSTTRGPGYRPSRSRGAIAISAGRWPPGARPSSQVRTGVLGLPIGRSWRWPLAPTGGLPTRSPRIAGQSLSSGILDRRTAASVARRILAPDMDSGWGIRTLAASEPAFDPAGYHTGSVWPHDTALIAAGLRRAGSRQGARSASPTDLLEAASSLPEYRLPELLRGDQRSPRTLLPAWYAGACPVQAWASAAPLHLVCASCSGSARRSGRPPSLRTSSACHRGQLAWSSADWPSAGSAGSTSTSAEPDRA